jgi:hypothetical protein
MGLTAQYDHFGMGNCEVLMLGWQDVTKAFKRYIATRAFLGRVERNNSESRTSASNCMMRAWKNRIGRINRRGNERHQHDGDTTKRRDKLERLRHKVSLCPE